MTRYQLDLYVLVKTQCGLKERRIPLIFEDEWDIKKISSVYLGKGEARTIVDEIKMKCKQEGEKNGI